MFLQELQDINNLIYTQQKSPFSFEKGLLHLLLVLTLEQKLMYLDYINLLKKSQKSFEYRLQY